MTTIPNRLAEFWRYQKSKTTKWCTVWRSIFHIPNTKLSHEYSRTQLWEPFGANLDRTGSVQVFLELLYSKLSDYRTVANTTPRRWHSLYEWHCEPALLPCWWWWQELGSPQVGLDAWLLHDYFYTWSVVSSPVVRSRYLSILYRCVQCEVRLTTFDPLQCSRMRSYHHHSCSWSYSSNQVCPLSALTSKCLDEQPCSYTAPGEHGAMRSW